jgi:hypothetical protein
MRDSDLTAGVDSVHVGTSSISTEPAVTPVTVFAGKKARASSALNDISVLGLKRGTLPDARSRFEPGSRGTASRGHARRRRLRIEAVFGSRSRRRPGRRMPDLTGSHSCDVGRAVRCSASGSEADRVRPPRPRFAYPPTTSARPNRLSRNPDDCIRTAAWTTLTAEAPGCR